MPTKQLTLEVTAKTNTGRIREANEDNFVVTPDRQSPDWILPKGEYVNSQGGTVMVIADGMGGLNAGEVASEITIESIKKHFSKLQSPKEKGKIASLMRDAIVQANGDIVRHSKAFPDTDGMGSTLVMAWVNGQELHLSWVGDSRCYLWRGGKLTQLSKDHSYVQTLVDEGKLTTEQAFFHPESNVITQSLGDSGRDPKPDYLTLPLSDNDILLLCSDGLNSMLQDNKIGEVITGAGDLLSGAEQLIEEANAAGGSDNITVILAKVVGGALSRAGDERPVTAIKKKNSSKKLVYGLLILAALATASFFGAPALMSKIRQHNGEDPIQKKSGDTAQKGKVVPPAHGAATGAGGTAGSHVVDSPGKAKKDDKKPAPAPAPGKKPEVKPSAKDLQGPGQRGDTPQLIIKAPAPADTTAPHHPQ